MSSLREAMTPVSVTVGTTHSMREAARRMTDAGTGAAVVIDSELPAPGIVTERDVLRVVGGGRDVDRERVGDHLSTPVVYAEPDWSLERAAEHMVRLGVRHIIVLDGPNIQGILSMRDIVRHWVVDRTALALPE